MYTHKEITNELLDSLVNDIEETVMETIFYGVGEHQEYNEDFAKELNETIDEVMLALVHKIKLKYLNKYTQD